MAEIWNGPNDEALEQSLRWAIGYLYNGKTDKLEWALRSITDRFVKGAARETISNNAAIDDRDVYVRIRASETYVISVERKTTDGTEPAEDTRKHSKAFIQTATARSM